MADIAGAIFDCDGTLIDSMQMWYGVFDRLIEGHDVEPTPELRERIEPMTIPDSCAMLHGEYGMGASAAALRGELEAMVADAYEHQIVEMPGAHAFVESLAAAGIPMVIASSTTSRLVRIGLAAHGLEGYFADVLCTAEVREGRDKDYPDVYLEALERLGTPLDQAWLFEDAPFAIRTAKRAGFRVAAIHNDHDGRDLGFIREWADIVSENYDTLTLECIRAYEPAGEDVRPGGAEAAASCSSSGGHKAVGASGSGMAVAPGSGAGEA